MHGLGPQLIAYIFETVEVDHSLAGNGPEPPRTRWVLEIASTHGRVDGGREYALARQAYDMLAVGRAKTIVTASQERLCGRRCRLRERVHLRDFDELHTRHF